MEDEPRTSKTTILNVCISEHETIMASISVVMPAYNAERFIKPAIESILNQSLKDFEFIIIDDQSTDGTRAIIGEYAAADARIRVLEGLHNGPGAAMNVGLKAATGDWVAVMHADDIALPHRLQRQMKMIKTDPAVVIWGSWGFRINAAGDKVSHLAVGPTTQEAFWQLRSNGKIVQAMHPTVILKHEIALQVGGYDDTLSVSEDVELFDRMLVHGTLLTIPEELLHYRIHGSSLSMTKYHMQREIVQYVMKRQRMRLANKQPQSLEDFRREYRSRPWWVRLNDARRDTRGVYYRLAGMAYGEKDYIGFIWKLAVAAILSPNYVIFRLHEQMLSSQSRQKLRGV